MIKRRLEDQIRDRLQNSPSAALIGPRQVGKTTLAFSISETIPSVYLDLENRTDLRKVQDIEAFHRENSDKLIILDEVQRLPEVFAPIRGLIDSERRKGDRQLSDQVVRRGLAGVVSKRTSLGHHPVHARPPDR